MLWFVCFPVRDFSFLWCFFLDKLALCVRVFTKRYESCPVVIYLSCVWTLLILAHSTDGEWHLKIEEVSTDVCNGL